MTSNTLPAYAAPTQPAAVQLRVPMPIPRTSNAPLFNGRYVADFLSILLANGRQAGITDNDELVPYILQYSSDRVKDHIRFLPEFDPDEHPSQSWTDSKAMLEKLYAGADKPPVVTEEHLKEYCRLNAAKSPFRNQEELDTYFREFQQLAAPLVKQQHITTKRRDYYFACGVPEGMQEWFNNLVPTANRTQTNPPTITQSLGFLEQRFDTTTLLYAPWKADEDIKKQSKVVRFDNDGNRAGDGVRSHTSATPGQPPKTSQSAQSNDPMDIITQRMEQLSLAQAQVVALLTQASRSNNNITTGAGQSRRCFVCNEVGTHPLHPSRCQEMKDLIRDGLAKYEQSTDRFVLSNGDPLPQVPPGFIGGVAAFIRAQSQNTLTASATNGRDTPPHLSTNSLGLSYGGSSVLEANAFVVTSLTPQFYADPVTRSGKDTGGRVDPLRRPEDRAPANKNRPASENIVTPKAKQPLTIPPPNNPINRQDGWKDSRPSNSKNKEDVTMKDEKKQATYHFTSDVQEMADASQVLKTVMNLGVSLPLFQLVGLSPALQKLLNENTRTRREYGAKPAEYNLASDSSSHEGQPDELFTTSTKAQDYEYEVKRLVVDANDGMVDKFLVRYSNAIAKVPEKRYYAMSTGCVSASFKGVTFTCLIDSGSELNLMSKSLPDRCGMAVDFEGMKWSLKGLHGDPERLTGCVTDAPLNIGGHEFSHHFFVSHQELGRHDMIIGQPFLQWFAARLEYERNGYVKMILWKQGDRSYTPTISVTITDPGDTRNTTTIGHTHKAHIEEVPDEEDFQS